MWLRIYEGIGEIRIHFCKGFQVDLVRDALLIQPLHNIQNFDLLVFNIPLIYYKNNVRFIAL